MADNEEIIIPPINKESAEDLGSILSNLNADKAKHSLDNYVKSTQTSTPINNNISENLGLIPKDKSPKKQSYSTEDSGQGIGDLLKNTQSWATDPHAYARPFTYGAGWRNMNFDRYYASNGFKELGFSPTRDNEALYNQNTNLYDDFKRAAPQFVNLMGYGAKHMIAPWTADDDADGYQRAMATGQSSKEGVGAFGINLGLNLGYSAGIIGEMVGEEALLALATIGSGGAAGEATIPVMITEAGRAGKNVYEGWKFLNSVKKTFDTVKSAVEARKLFELAKSGTSVVAKWVNPFENVAEFTNDAIKGLNGVDKLTTFAKVHKGVGSLVRDMKNIKATWGEANLEGGMAENDQREKLIHDFYDKHGRLPQSESEINDIKMKAANVGNHTALANIGLIYMSNKIVFDTAFKGIPSFKKILAESTDNLGSKVIIGGVETEAKAISKYSLQGLKAGLKQTPYNLLKGSLRYSTKNLVEGVQELGQDVISSAYKDYYDPKYKDDHLAAYPSLSDSFVKGFGEQFSKQGWETFASGFLMGGMMQGPQKLLFNTIPKAFTRITNPADYAIYKKNKEDYINSIVNTLNDVRNKRTDYINLLADNFANQKRAVKSITDIENSGDVKTHKDIQDEAMFDHIHTLLRTGRESFLKEQLDGLTGLNESELSEAFGGIDGKEATKRINSFADRVDAIKDHYDKIEKAFPNPFDLNVVNKNKNPNAYFDMQLKHNVFNFYKKQIVFAQHTFDRTLDRMEAISQDWSNNKPLANMPLGDVSLLLNPKNIQSELDTLRGEISLLRQSQLRSDKAQLNKKIQRLNQLKEFSDNVNGYRQALILRDKAQTNKESWTEAQKRFAMVSGAEVKTKKGDVLKIDVVHPDGRRVKLSNGRLYDAKSLEVVSSSQDLSEHLDGLVSRSLESLHTTYKDYLKGVARTTGDQVLDSKLNDSFDKLKDYYALNHESYTMANAINILTDPNSSRNIFDSYVKAKRELEDKKAEKVEEGLKVFLSKIENDDLLNGIYQAGVFVLPDELKALVDDGKVPEHFLDATTKQEVEKDNPKYKAAIAIIEKYKAIVKDKSVVEEVEFTNEPVQTANGLIRIIRHGETIEDEQGVNSGPTQEHITAEGVKHVEQGAEGNVDETLTKIIVSSRQRAKDSADVIAKGKDIVIEENKVLDPWNTGDEKTGFAEIPDEDWHKFADWFATHPEERVYTGEDAELKEKYPNRELIESFNDFKNRVLDAMPVITNALSDGGAIMTHSNVIQLLKAYVENGSKNDANINILYVKNEASKNGEFIEFQRKEINPSFIEKKVITPKEKALKAKLVRTPQDIALAKIKVKLDSVNDEEALDVLIQDIESKIGREYTSDGIEDLINARKKELSLVVDWQEISDGDLLVHETYGKVQVMKKESTYIQVKEFGLNGKKSFRVYKHDLNKDIKHKWREGMETTIQSALDDKEKKLAKTNHESNVHFTEDAAQMQKLADEAEKEGNKKVTDDFFNDLGCK